MGIVIVIVAGLVLMTAVAGAADVLGKRQRATGDRAGGERVAALERRLEALERAAADKDLRIEKLEGELRFVSRLLEDKSGEPRA